MPASSPARLPSTTRAAAPWPRAAPPTPPTPKPRAERLGRPGRNPYPFAAQMRAQQTNRLSPDVHELVPHAEPASHVVLLTGHPIRPPIEPVPIRLRGRRDIAPISFHPPSASRIHGRVIRIGDHDLVAKTFQMLGDLFPAATTLHQNPHWCPSGDVKSIPGQKTCAVRLQRLHVAPASRRAKCHWSRVPSPFTRVRPSGETRLRSGVLRSHLRKLAMKSEATHARSFASSAA
jgi:hypothetical protein